MSRANISLADPKRALIKTIETLSHARRTWEVFRDFTEMTALTISNSVDAAQREPREARYMEIVRNYSKEEANQLAFALACVVECLEAGFDDCLGQIFMEMDLGSHWHGQYFTPYPVASMMARTQVGTDLDRLFENTEEFTTVLEPAVGSGVMVIALAEALHDAKINYQQSMHVTAIDIDITAVHMAYIQFSLFHIPAVVIHGNTLSMETRSSWRTPAHVLGLWDRKLARRHIDNASAPTVTPSPEALPTVSQERRPITADITLPSQLTLL